MVNYNRLKKENEKLNEKTLSEMYEWQSVLDKIAADAHRTSEIAKYSSILIDDLDDQFERATGLNKTDVTFLFFATALQCIRQYVIGSITQRVDDKTAAKNTKGHGIEHSDRKHRLYNPSLEEILTNPVPFDAIYGKKTKDKAVECCKQVFNNGKKTVTKVFNKAYDFVRAIF